MACISLYLLEKKISSAPYEEKLVSTTVFLLIALTHLRNYGNRYYVRALLGFTVGAFLVSMDQVAAERHWLATATQVLGRVNQENRPNPAQPAVPYTFKDNFRPLV